MDRSHSSRSRSHADFGYNTLYNILVFFSKSLRTRSYSIRAHVKKEMAYEGDRKKEHFFFASLPSRAIFLAHVSGERSMNAPL